MLFRKKEKNNAINFDKIKMVKSKNLVIFLLK